MRAKEKSKRVKNLSEGFRFYRIRENNVLLVTGYESSQDYSKRMLPYLNFTCKKKKEREKKKDAGGS